MPECKQNTSEMTWYYLHIIYFLRTGLNLTNLKCSIQRSAWETFLLHPVSSCVFLFFPQYIFKSQEYNKPFFSTFTKTSMFVLYLLGFLLWRPWRQQCTGSMQRRQSAFVSRYPTLSPPGGTVCTYSFLCCWRINMYKWSFKKYVRFVLKPYGRLQLLCCWWFLQDADAYFAPCTTDTTVNSCLVCNNTAEKTLFLSSNSNGTIWCVQAFQ